MPSELGKFIRAKREAANLGLRELSRRIKKSPSFVSQLELDKDPPPASEDTLRTIAQVLKIDPDQLFALANLLPFKLKPETTLELALYRRVKSLSPKEQQELLGEHKRESKVK
jgi:transcriptional regulator with XRE-family HTH domain